MSKNCSTFSDSFIKEFAPLYYRPEKHDVEARDNYNKSCEKWGLSLNSVDQKAEEVVMGLLQSGTFGERALAWKAGKVDWSEEKLDLDYNQGFIKDEAYLIGRGKRVLKNDFEKYIELLDNLKDELNMLASEKKYSQAYIKALYITAENEEKKHTPTPEGFGPVNIINALFFVTKEKFPIYDAFAHIAVRALIFDCSPNRVFLGSNPDKKDVQGVTRMFEEYMLLLEKAFPSLVNTDGEKPFIPRDLDRALWVYGHSCKKFDM